MPGTPQVMKTVSEKAAAMRCYIAIAGLGDVAFEQGQYQEATVHLKAALRLQPPREHGGLGREPGPAPELVGRDIDIHKLRSRLGQALADLLVAQGLAFEVLFHQGVVPLGGGLDQRRHARRAAQALEHASLAAQQERAEEAAAGARSRGTPAEGCLRRGASRPPTAPQEHPHGAHRL